MGISVSIPGQQTITIKAGSELKSLGTESTSLNGLEQTVLERPGGETTSITGYIDLSGLLAGDVAVVALYIKMTAISPWKTCYKEIYTGHQELPIVHVAKRPENHGLKVTIQQTAGAHKNIIHEFFEES